VQVIVVGGGVIGLLTGVECVLAGADVTLVDQGDIPHVHGASYDRHRIVRALHPGNAPATRAAVAARRGWIDLERRLRARFYHGVDALTVLPPDEIAASLHLMSTAGAPARSLSPDELAVRHGHIRFPAGMAAILETGAGVVLADRALATIIGWLRSSAGVRVCRRRRVVGVDGDAGAVRLADGALLYGDRIVVAAGPWSRDMLPAEVAAGLTLYRQSMLYCQVPGRLRDAWATTPVIPALGNAEGAWLVPPVEGTPLKVSAASACRAVSTLTDHHTPDRWHDHLVDLFTGLLGGFQSGWVVASRDCYYLAQTSTGGPMLTALGDGNAWAYAACGGSSFKFAPLLARLLTQRVIGADPVPTELLEFDHLQPIHAGLDTAEEFRDRQYAARRGLR
jgi:sarcosine oxidase